MQRDNDFRILRFVHQAQSAATKLRAPVGVIAAALVYALLLEILEVATAVLAEPERKITSHLRGQLRGIIRRADGKTREEDAE